MSDSDDSGPSPWDASGGDSRQLLLVALCVLGLVVAAFALPTLSGAQSPGGGDAATTTPDGGQAAGSTTRTTDDGPGGGTGDGGGGGSDGGGGSGDGWGDGGGDVTTVRTLVLDGDGPGASCVVAVEGRQIPGSRVTVHVWLDGEPAADRDVWFNGRYVGATAADGRVNGRVPYESRLRVNVSLPDEASCEFVYAREAESEAAQSVAAGGLPGWGALDGAMDALDGLADAPDDRTDAPPGASGGEPAAMQPEDGNHSGTYPVDGAVTVRVQGRAMPGETVTVVANVEGVPMRDAAVTVDGERVGRTDDAGRYELRLPDDGTEQVTVAVSRGDFDGSTTARIRVLEVAVVPEGLLATPGARATVRATAAGDPVQSAVVTVDGRRLGTTDADGETGLRLPADPGATVRVQADGRTATTTLWAAYAPTILAAVLAGLALVASLAVAYRRRGARGLGSVAALWLAVAAVVGASVVAGRTAGLLVLALLALAGVAVFLRRRADAVAGGAGSVAAAVAALVEWLLGRALRVTDALTTLAARARDALGDLPALLASPRRSASALLARAASWLGELPGRVRAGLPRRLDRRSVAAAALAVAVVVAATVVAGSRGFLAALGLLAVAVVAWAVRRRSSDDADSATAESLGDARATPTANGAGTAARPSLRERWRTFARWVAPAGWRRRTPGEVSRAAVERGFPREPVAELTRVFREVEYGDRPLSPERRDRAEAAFDALAAARRRDGEEEP
jgi:hypothetical protein